MPQQPHSNKKKIAKGIKFLLGSLPLAFLGPLIIYSAFGNQDKPLYIPILILGFLVAIAAVYCMFRGILTIVHGFFND